MPVKEMELLAEFGSVFASADTVAVNVGVTPRGTQNRISIGPGLAEFVWHETLIEPNPARRQSHPRTR